MRARWIENCGTVLLVIWVLAFVIHGLIKAACYLWGFAR